MIRFLATLLQPIATAEAWWTDRRVHAAQLQAAADTARIEACGRGTCCHTRDTYRPHELDWCD